MTAGDKTYNGLGVPLWGESTITQTTLATDILTIEGIASQSGDFLVCRDSGQTEKFVVDVSGNVTAAGTLAVTGATTFTGAVTHTASAIHPLPPILNYAIATTAPTTGLTTGQIFFYDAANVRTFAIAAGPGAIWRVAMTNN